jgi:hypothetical protein
MKRGESASGAYYVYYSLVIVMMPICILLDMFRTAQTFEVKILFIVCLRIIEIKYLFFLF